MKKLLCIVGLLFAIMQFIPNTELKAEPVPASVAEAVVKNKNDAEEMQYHIEILSKDLKNSNFLTPRRTVQPFSLISETRTVSGIVRNIQEIRIKGADRLQRISESVSRLQAINYSALLTRMGYRVYALREIII